MFSLLFAVLWAWVVRLWLADLAFDYGVTLDGGVARFFPAWLRYSYHVYEYNKYEYCISSEEATDLT